MKFSRMFAMVAGLAILTSMVTTTAASADCYFDSNGTVVVDSSGQCVITNSGPPMGPIPDSGSSSASSDMGSTASPSSPTTGAPTPTQSATPSATPSASATPTPTPTPSASATPKGGVTGTLRPPAPVLHTIGPTQGLINSSAIQLITITDLNDPKIGVSCFYAPSCSLLVPPGHLFGFTVTHDKSFLMLANNDFLTPKLTFGSYMVSGQSSAKTETYFSYTTYAPELTIQASGSSNQTLRLSGIGTTDKGGSLYSNLTPITLEPLEPVTLTPNLRFTSKINWKGLPKGLTENADGTISGSPSVGGIYYVSAPYGEAAKPSTFQFSIVVKRGLTPPDAVTAKARGYSEADVSFISTVMPTDPKSIPDYYEVRVIDEATQAQTIATFSGSETSDTVSGLKPGSRYKIDIRAMQIASGKKSEYSNVARVTLPVLPVTFISANKGFKVTNELVPGTANTVLVTVGSSKAMRTFSSFVTMANLSPSSQKVTAAELKAFNKGTNDINISPSGYLSGVMKTLPQSIANRTIAIGNWIFKFQFKPASW